MDAWGGDVAAAPLRQRRQPDLSGSRKLNAGRRTASADVAERAKS